MTHSKPRLSIVVTTHHRPVLLARALRSILQQASDDIEIILCADESSAQTRSVAADLLRPCDTFVCNPNLKGPAETRNLGMQLARGQWLCMLDDDDTYADGHLAALRRLFDRPAGLYFFNFSEILEDTTDQPGYTQEISRKIVDLSGRHPKDLLAGNFIPNSAFMLDRDAAVKEKFDSHLNSLEDWDWLIALIHRGVKFTFEADVPGPIIHLLRSVQSRNRMGSSALDALFIYRK